VPADSSPPGSSTPSAQYGTIRPHRWTAAKNWFARQNVRTRVDEAIDLFRLRLDTFPDGIYQPVPSLPSWLGVTRAEGTESRWRAMSDVLDRVPVRTGLDIGANVGYFCVQLASRGVHTIALEPEPRVVRIALLAVRRSGLENLGVLSLAVGPDNLDMVPPSDCVVYLSVWHHMVRWHGEEKATAMLAEIWNRTGKVLFFDTGEKEMPPDYRLPDMGPDAREWLADYLGRTCAGGTVEHLGLHGAFDAVGAPCERNLFAIIRDEA
jgi:FkbM family methyltransferase